MERTTNSPGGFSPPVEADQRYSGHTSAPLESPETAFTAEQVDDNGLEDDKSMKRSKQSVPSASSSTIGTDSNVPLSRHASLHANPTRLSQTHSHFSHISRSRSIPDGGSDEPDVERKSTDHNESDRDPNLIDWDGPDDPEHPMNFSRARKWFITMLLGLVTLSVTFASSVFSTATQATSQAFNVSNEVMVLGTSLFVLGFAVGPPIWGPLSELYGRKYPLFIGFFIFAIFQIPVAVAQNLQTIMVCRFFGGVFGSAPLGIVGGQLTDFWDSLDRSVALTVFAGATFVGPAAGPIVGGFIVQSHLGWRWTGYITAIMAFFFSTLGVIFVPETFGPVLLKRRAARIRFETRNWAIHSRLDEQQVDLRNIATKYLIRPFAMLSKEPILILVTVYMSLIYGILYIFFEAYPIAFQEQRGWNSGVGALPFLSLTMGVLIGVLIIVYMTKTRFARILEREGHVAPEERLIPMIMGGALFPAGMFWFAWTSSPNITWVPQVLSGIFIGAGVLMIFLQGLNYIIDVYTMYANSAIAGNTMVRSGFGAGFPLFATAM